MERANQSMNRKMAVQSMDDSQYCDFLAAAGYHTLPTMPPGVYMTTPPPSLPGSPSDNSKSEVTHMHAGGIARAAWLTPPPDSSIYQAWPYDGSNDVIDSPSPYTTPMQDCASSPLVRPTFPARQTRSAAIFSPASPSKIYDVATPPMLGSYARSASLLPSMRNSASTSSPRATLSSVDHSAKRPSDSELMPPPARRLRLDNATQPMHNPSTHVQYRDVDGRSNTDPSMRTRYGLPLWVGPHWAPVETGVGTSLGVVQSPTMMATLPFGGLIEVAEYYK
nr:hypothetical protein B0A51_02853 [Rachicladosporium sp. CCFEE 5018]